MGSDFYRIGLLRVKPWLTGRDTQCLTLGCDIERHWGRQLKPQKASIQLASM